MITLTKLPRKTILFFCIFYCCSFFSEADSKNIFKSTESEQLITELQKDIQALLQTIASEQVDSDISQFNYFFGISSQQEVTLGLDIDIADPSQGYTVLSVVPNSSADKAGLKRNDTIIAIQSTKINAANEALIFGVLQGFKVGDEIIMTIETNGKQRQVSMIVGGYFLPDIEFSIGTKP